MASTIFQLVVPLLAFLANARFFSVYLQILRRRYGGKSSQAEGAVYFLQGVIPTVHVVLPFHPQKWKKSKNYSTKFPNFIL